MIVPTAAELLAELPADVDPEGLSLAQIVALLPEEWWVTHAEWLNHVVESKDWGFYGRPKQFAPEGDWYIWLIRCGRGWGKNRTGAEWLKQKQREVGNGFRATCVAATFGDGRDIMVEGESGLLSVLAPSHLRTGSREDDWNRGVGELFLANDGYIKVHSSEKAARLRGPQWHAAHADEAASWSDAGLGTAEDTTWSNLTFGCRLGLHPQIVVTTTPKPNRLIKELSDPTGKLAGSTRVTVASSYENLTNLAPTYRTNVIDVREGTRLGRQEIHGEILDDAGDVFDTGKIRFVREPPHGRRFRVRVWDLAASEPSDRNPDPDWTCGSLISMDLKTRDTCVEEVIRFRKRAGARNRRLREQAEWDAERFGRGFVWHVEREPGSGGTAQVDQLAIELDGLVVVKPLSPKGDKLVRADSAVASIDRGQMSFVAGVWNEAGLEEMREFTGEKNQGGHDDFVDTISAFFIVAPAKARTWGYAPLSVTKVAG